MLWLFRLIKGYLYIKISGTNAYELINRASVAKAPIYSCKYVKGEVFGFVTIENFKKLRRHKRGIKCRVKIIKKQGIPFLIARYKNRYGILVGSILFFLFLEFMSGFIWNIDVVGNNSIPDNEILNVCKEIGVFEGARVNKIDTMNFAQQLLLKNENLAWASFNIETCNLTVNVTEIKKKDNKKTLSNLIANDDGIVEKIDVTSGNVLVKVGQQVQKGDLLVSGIFEKADETVFTVSKGEIFVKQTKKFTYEEKYVQKKVLLKGNDINIKQLVFLGFKIPISFKNTSNCQKISSNKESLILFEKKLPICVNSATYKQKENTVINFTKEELLSKIQRKCNEDIKNLSAVRFTEEGSTVTDLTDGLLVEKTYVLIRNIAAIEEIIIDSSN